MAEKKYYYKLVRLDDDHTVQAAFFKSVTIRIERENEFTEFPPKEGDHIVVYNNVFNFWQTTEVQYVEEISENEFEFTTLNSTYRIQKLEIEM